MRKNAAKKLTLHKETLRALTDDQARKILGGIGPSDLEEDSCHKTCWCQPTQ